MSTNKTVPLKPLIEALIAAGWHDEWMLREPMMTRNDGRASSGLVLRIGLYPVASVEVLAGSKAPTESDSPIDGELLRIRWDGSAATSLDGRMMWDGLPRPRQLWKHLGRSWSDAEPRVLLPMTPKHATLGLAHSLALARILDALLEGVPRVRAALPMGPDMTTVAIEACWRLLKTKKRRNALVVVDRSDAAEELRLRLQEQQDVPVARIDGPPSAASSIDIVTIGYLAARGWEHLRQMERERYDLIVVPSLQKQPSMDRLLEHFAEAGLIGVHGSHERDMPSPYGRLVYERPLEEVLSEAELQPPGTHKLWLGEIAEIIHGWSRTWSKAEEKVPAAILTVSGIPADETTALVLGEDQTLPKSFVDLMRLRSGDIVLPLVIRDPRMALPVGVIPELGSRVVVAKPSLIIIRLTDPQIDRREVVEYLKSSVAMTYLQINAQSTTGYSRITIRSLRLMPILLRVGEAAPAEPAPPASRYSEVLTVLRNEALPALEVERLEEVATILRWALSKIAPKSLEDVVLDEFPTPIALAWRRYHDSRFNPYEQVLRLRDVFEAAAFFVYNVMLANHLRGLDSTQYKVEDKKARRAWRGAGSMVDRMAFVDSLLKAAEKNSPNDLFLSRLVGTKVVDTVKELQSNFRNHVSHSAAATASRQRSLIEKYEPMVRALLHELSWLASLRLVMIPSFFRHDGKMMRRVELYRGVVPIISEEQVASGGLGTAPDRDHLVLLDGEERVLDLFPMYQMVENDKTGYQRHLCCMKSAKDGQKTIVGEDAHTSLELDLPGYDLLVELQKPHQG